MIYGFVLYISDNIIYTLSFLLSAGSFTIPTERGFCTNSQGLMPSSCFCETTMTPKNVETECMSYCNNDYNCTGYYFTKPSFGSNSQFCRFFTVSPCPAECSKSAFFGDTGDLINHPYPYYSGCYIKLGTV